MRALWLAPLLLCFILSSVNAATCPDRCNCDSSKKCISCVKGNIFVNGGCDGCPVGCDKCAIIATQGTAYWTKCVGSCQKGCASCNSDYTCGQCSRGFGPYEGQCFACEAGCEQCRITQVYTNTHYSECTAKCPDRCNCDSSKKCISCVKGNIFVNGGCDGCPVGCDKCEIIATQGTAYWTKCVGSCQKGCASCNSDYTCGQCSRGFGPYEGQCFSCDSGCDKCTVTQVYTDSHNTQCTGSCQTGCSRCNSDYTCAQCNVDYVLADGQCRYSPAPTPTPAPDNNNNNNNNVPTPNNSSSSGSSMGVLVVVGLIILAAAAFFFIKRGKESQRTNVQEDYVRAMAAEKQRQAAQNVAPQNYQYQPPQAYPQGYNQGYPQGPQGYPQGPQGYPQGNQSTQQRF